MKGTPFGRYRLINLLGRGGMGEVWRAHDSDTDRVVALKLLPPHLSQDEDFQRRFRREAHAAARLNSPHVIPIHHYGEIDGRLYVDMRLIEGRDLAALIAEGSVDPARAIRIVEQVAKALHAAHQAGLLHRDVKPSNVLLGDDDFAYLIDFGIARTMDETRMTQTGAAIGTFHYIAPERLAIGAEEDARADIYSLACVLYEALTGGPPFPGETVPQLVAAHLNSPPPLPSTTQPDVPIQIDAVIAKGMAKDPNQRYATTIELATAASHALTASIRRAPTAPTAPVTIRSAPTPAPLTPSPPEPPPPPAIPTALIPAASQRSQGRRQGWRPLVVAAVVIAVVILTAAAIAGYPPFKHSRTVASVAKPALEELLLSPQEINAAMDATEMSVDMKYDAIQDVNEAITDKTCIYLLDPILSATYKSSPWKGLPRLQLTRGV